MRETIEEMTRKSATISLFTANCLAKTELYIYEMCVDFSWRRQSQWIAEKYQYCWGKLHMMKEIKKSQPWTGI